MTTTTPAALRSRRLAAGLTQAELAARAKCSLAFIGNLERGYVPERSQVLGRIDAALNKKTPAPATAPRSKADGAGRRESS